MDRGPINARPTRRQPEPDGACREGCPHDIVVIDEVVGDRDVGGDGRAELAAPQFKSIAERAAAKGGDPRKSVAGYGAAYDSDLECGGIHVVEVIVRDRDV